MRAASRAAGAVLGDHAAQVTAVVNAGAAFASAVEFDRDSSEPH